MVGKTRRMRRLFDRQERTLIVAVDHAAFGAPGPADPPTIVAAAVRAGADAILASWEIAQASARELERAGLILRLDGGQSLERAVLQHTAEDALRVAADAVCAMLSPWSDLEVLQALGQACARWQIPLMLEFPLEEADASAVVSAAGAATAAGANLLKLPFVQPTTLFGDIVRRCPVPVIILGGGRVSSDALLSRVGVALEAGAAGVAVGRNVWQHPDPALMIHALAEVVRKPFPTSR